MALGFGLGFPRGAASGGGAANPRFAIDATGEQIRAAMSDVTAWGYSPHNLVRYSEDATQWTAGGSAALTDYQTITFNSSSDFVYNTLPSAPAAGSSLTLVIEIKAGTKTGTVRFRDTNASGGVTITLTSEWQRVTFTFSANAGGSNPALDNRVAQGGDGGTGTILVRRLQANFGPVATTYVPTTTTALGPTAPGWRIPGIAGARVNASARTSVAMEQAQDGTWGYARHNMIRNSTMVGAVAGSPGTRPTGWGTIWTATTAGLSLSIAGTGTENGMPYIDVRIAGTSTGTGSILCLYGSGTDTTAIASQTWTHSAYFKIVAGSKGNLSIRPALRELTSGGSSVAVVLGDGTEITSTTLTRSKCTAVLTGGTTARVEGVFRVAGDGSSTYDVTVRVAQPELYQGQLRGGILPTTNAAVYGPAIDWLSAQSTYGVRSEAAATNLLTYSAQFDNAAWTLAAASISANAAAAPDGTTTADTLIPDATSTQHRVQQLAATLANATQYTASVYAKAAGYNFVVVRMTDAVSTADAIFNLGTGTVGAISNSSWSDGSSTITAIGNGWYRCTFTATSNAAGAGTGGVRYNVGNPSSNGDLSAWSGDTTSGIYLWGAQLETGTIATSPILTYDATATRAADTVVVPDTSPGWIGQSVGTLAVEYVPLVFTSRALTLNDNTANNALSCTLTAATAGGDTYVSGSFVGVAVGVPSTYTVGTLYRHALAYEANNGVVAMNGTVCAVDTVYSVPATTQMLIGVGRSGSTASPGNCHVTHVRYVARRLLDAALVALTA